MRRRTRVVIGGGVLLALTAVVAAAVLGFPKESAADASTRAIELPQDFRATVSALCSSDVELAGIDRVSSAPDGSYGPSFLQFGVGDSGAGFTVTIESAGNWAVSVDSAGVTLKNERPSASAVDVERMSSVGSVVIPAAVSVYNCMAPFRFATRDVPPPPTSSSQLLQLYRYDSTVLWPCLTSHGIKMGDAPSRDQFVSSVSALTADPFSAMTPTRKMLPRLAAALQACPLRPAYLG